ncbi:MAG: MBL fold metallo-hydrolase [Alphaproteobacteria bacterium]|jgi:N-acyl homoserine lactone hydrolase|nr:MBL fold metallo-hydrolase [Alphaproteobacteria bacterium]
MSTYPIYDVIVTGSSAKLDVGYIAISNCTLIHTAEGPVLFDVGGTVAREMIRVGLKQRGLQLSDITRIYLSHLHHDHALNIDMFPYRTKVFVSRAEWNYVDHPNPADDWVPWMIKEQVSKYDLTLLEGSGDLSYGVRYFQAPGHTPGSQALALSSADGKTTVLAGDAIKFPKEALRRRVDHSFDTPEVAAKSIDTIMRMADVIVPGHFPTIYKEGDSITWDDCQSFPLVMR